MSELGGSQISTLLETLPGIANVLRSPVADALGNVIRAAARLWPTSTWRTPRSWFGTRPAAGLLGQDEGDRMLAEVHAAAAEARWTRRPTGRRPAGQGAGEGQGKRSRPVKAVKKVKVKKAAKGEEAVGSSSGLELLHQRRQPRGALKQVARRRRPSPRCSPLLLGGGGHLLAGRGVLGGGLAHLLGALPQLLHDPPVRHRLPLHLRRRGVHLLDRAARSPPAPVPRPSPPPRSPAPWPSRPPWSPRPRAPGCG